MLSMPHPLRTAPHSARIRALLVATLAILVQVRSDASPLRAEEQIRNAMQLDANAQRGAKLYAQHCSRCHAPQAIGNPQDAVPSLAGQRRAYLIKQLADFSELEREGRVMHPVISSKSVADPQAWADIAGYLNALKPATAPETGDGGGVELGEAIYHEQCASCHEEDARGDDDGFVPSLRDQHYSYLARQMRKIGSWHRLNVEPDLVRFIDSLDSEELTALADYLSRLHGPVRDRSRLNDDGTVTD